MEKIERAIQDRYPQNLTPSPQRDRNRAQITEHNSNRLHQIRELIDEKDKLEIQRQDRIYERSRDLKQENLTLRSQVGLFPADYKLIQMEDSLSKRDFMI